MKLVAEKGNPFETELDVLILGIHDSWSSSFTVRKAIEATDGWLERMLNSGEISWKSCKTSLLLNPPGIKAAAIMLVGMGTQSEWNASNAFRVAASASKACAGRARNRIGFLGMDGPDLIARSAVVGSCVGSIGQDIFRNERSLFQPDEVVWFGISDEQLRKSLAISESIELARRLVNLPPNILYPASFVEEATKALQTLPVEIEVWDETRLKQERCGALLAVSQGSSREPQLMIMRYQGDDDPNRPPIALVGKGVTFDSGGLSLKPTDSMLTMKCDMAGAATVLASMQGLARLQVKRNVIGLVGLVENMINGSSFRLGDVLIARSGKTIEVHNTDAEGRLVLADVLDVAVESKPSHMIDFATLTGACVVALGTDIVGLMSNNDSWQNQVLEAAKACGEFAWPLPMHDFFSEQIAGKVADIKNVGEGRWGGATTAAKFLQEFVRGIPWVHADIAGPAFADAAKPWCDMGGTGVMVRTVIEMLLQTDKVGGTSR